MKPLENETWFKQRKVSRWGASEQFVTPVELIKAVNLERGQVVDICLHTDLSYTVYPESYYQFKKEGHVTAEEAKRVAALFRELEGRSELLEVDE